MKQRTEIKVGKFYIHEDTKQEIVFILNINKKYDYLHFPTCECFVVRKNKKWRYGHGVCNFINLNLDLLQRNYIELN